MKEMPSPRSEPDERPTRVSRRRTVRTSNGRSRSTFYINGRFLGQRITGIQRYAREILGELDALLAAGAAGSDRCWRLVAPRGIEFPALTHIRCSHEGFLEGHAWEQLELPWITRDGFLVSFCSTGPWFKRDQTITVHDASVYRVPDAFSWKFRTWYRLVISQVVRRSPRTMVVSRFSAREAEMWFGARPGRLDVMCEGWQHMQRVDADDSILRTHGLEPRSYVLAVSSPTPNKNFALISEAVRRLADVPVRFIIAGAADGRVFASGPDAGGERVTRVGYVTDVQLRSLYENALCFVFPSKYEGFGIPVLEAMGLGCPVVASSIDALQEVCGDAARYFDPSDGAALARILRELSGSESELARMRERGRQRAAAFSWREGARRSLDAILACTQPRS
jgi:glycosyltransferase involved in cell wall biosynthesis